MALLLQRALPDPLLQVHGLLWVWDLLVAIGTTATTAANHMDWYKIKWTGTSPFDFVLVAPPQGAVNAWSRWYACEFTSVVVTSQGAVKVWPAGSTITWFRLEAVRTCAQLGTRDHMSAASRTGQHHKAEGSLV